VRCSPPRADDRAARHHAVGLTLGNLQDERAGQLVLAFDRRRTSALDAALDDVRERFGSDAITRGVLVGRDQGLSVPLLPD
jgi:DNA polymerase-4